MKIIQVFIGFCIFFTLSCKSQHNQASESQQNLPDINNYFGFAAQSMKQMQFKKALDEWGKGYALIDPKNSKNSTYLSALTLKSTIFSYFECLDSAEFYLLKWCGLDDVTINKMVNSRAPLNNQQYEKIAADVTTKLQNKEDPDLYVVLSFIYNILGNSDKVKQEQQNEMDNSPNRDASVTIALQLYKIRNRKIDCYSSMLTYANSLKTAPKDSVKNIELNLGTEEYYLGWFPDADAIATKYLKLNPKDEDFLFLKMNIEMGEGDYDSMKEYEGEIRKIDPKAFDK